MTEILIPFIFLAALFCVAAAFVFSLNFLQNNYRSFSPSFRREFKVLKRKVESGEIKLFRMAYDNGKTIGVFKSDGGDELFRIYDFPSVSKPGEEYFGQNSNISGYAELRRWAEKVVGENEHKKEFQKHLMGGF